MRKKTGSIYRRRLITKTDSTQLYQKLRWKTGAPSQDEVRAALHPRPQCWAFPKFISDVSLSKSVRTEKTVECSLFRVYFLNANITDSCGKFPFLIGDLIVNTKTHKHILSLKSEYISVDRADAVTEFTKVTRSRFRLIRLLRRERTSGFIK